jgi:hypothetical protein
MSQAPNRTRRQIVRSEIVEEIDLKLLECQLARGPKSGGFDNSGLDSTDCSEVAERPYSASSYPGHHFEAGGNGLPLQKISDTAPRR